MCHVVQRHGDGEVIFQFTDKLENLERIEPQVCQQLVVELGLDRAPADALENVDGVLLEPIGDAGSRRYLDQT